MHAHRNVRLCTKDCLCLFVCPTGASDTETGQIDENKCIGCGACALACPSGALSMVPKKYPPQQKKTQDVVDALFALAKSKTEQEAAFDEIANTTDDKIVRQLAQTFSKSSRIMAEDIVREAGYMLPQSDNAHKLLNSMLNNGDADFPKQAVEQLLELIPNNDKETEDDNMNKTQDNLMTAFAGESQANRKYLAYAKKAEAEGKVNTAKLFKVTADAETIHAFKEFELAGMVGTTADNLKDAIAGEKYEYEEMYPGFNVIAAEEGNKAAEITFTFAKKAEAVHADLFTEALNTDIEAEEVTYYLCPVCGNIEKSRPDKCFICNVPGAKFIEY